MTPFSHPDIVEELVHLLEAWAEDRGFADLIPADLRAGVMREAAKGNHDAQGAVADDLLLSAARRWFDPCEALFVAEPFARLAQESGRAWDFERVAVIKMFRARMAHMLGQEQDKQRCEGEALYFMDRAASAGSVNAEGALLELAQAVSPEGAAYAAMLGKGVSRDAV
jgi:hypothetical protein